MLNEPVEGTCLFLLGLSEVLFLVFTFRDGRFYSAGCWKRHSGMTRQGSNDRFPVAGALQGEIRQMSSVGAAILRKRGAWQAIVLRLGAALELWGARQATNEDHRFLAARTFRRRQRWCDLRGWLPMIQ